MTDEERAAHAKHARDARRLLPRRRRRRFKKEIKPGDKLPAIVRTLGLVGVRKMAVGVLQQQIESMRDRALGIEDREFLIEVVKALVSGEKIQKLPNNSTNALKVSGDSQGSPLPPLSTNGGAK